MIFFFLFFFVCDQVGRLSRQAGEEGVERRRAEQRVQELEDLLHKTNDQINKFKESLDSAHKARDNLSEANSQLTSTIVRFSPFFLLVFLMFYYYYF